jgi:competence protein ComEC
LLRECIPRWLKLDRNSLVQTGGLSLVFGAEPQVESVDDRVGNHPWSGLR